MIYYSYDLMKMMPREMDDILQQYFSGTNFGVSCVLDDLAGNIDVVCIDTVEGDVKGKQTWTHYANIQRTDSGTWELNEQFKGDDEREMWIYGTFHSFRGAVRNLSIKGTSLNGRKPKEIYV